jgi:hypothetical protein
MVRHRDDQRPGASAVEQKILVASTDACATLAKLPGPVATAPAEMVRNPLTAEAAAVADPSGVVGVVVVPVEAPWEFCSIIVADRVPVVVNVKPVQSKVASALTMLASADMEDAATMIATKSALASLMLSPSQGTMEGTPAP